ncbi:MAG: GC-type dockerin domain-anchored protein [Planctomycetota bacterium]|nr:GC-type dockerin domain-anchored protein [Planctomycetota bacterium]
MKRLATGLFAGGVLLCAGAARLSAQPFFAGIGSLDGGTLGSIAEGVSADGAVVSGDSRLNAFYPNEGVIWTRDQGLRSIVPGRYSDCEGGGINGTGTVVTGGIVGNGTRYVYRWTPETGAVDLGDLDGGKFRSGATGVSARGDVVVGYGASDNGDWEAFRWTEETGMVGLGDLPGGNFGSSATAISADGFVVVGSSSNEFGNVAFRWTEETGMVSIGELAGGRVSGWASGVSADGAVVVGSSWAEDGLRGFRWTSEAGMVALEKIHPDQYQQRVYATSWDGNVMIGDAYVNGVGGAGLMYWTLQDGPRWLLDVFDEHGVVVPDEWSLDGVLGLSADGRTIVGYGRISGLGTQGWVAYLGPTCRADYDDDGTVTTADVSAYLLAWQQRSIFADWNYDGYINTIDIIGFLNEWAAGC